VLGLFFHGEHWLGGYASLQRRMYRLGHISFFGLGAVNLLFCLTAQSFSLSGPLIHLASQAFIVGAIAMPVCCGIMAHFPRAHLIFAVPVISLILGGVLVLFLVVRQPEAAGPASSAFNSQPSTLNRP
jgi:ABC-type branched-subunit amino acid transport system permease subunit